MNFSFLTKSLLARNTAYMSVGYGLRLAVQALYFVLIARALGANNYGAFIGVVALVGILYPFAGLGSGSLIVEKVSRDRRLFPSMWGKALSTILICGSILVAGVLVTARFALPATVPSHLVLAVAASDIFGLNIISVGGQVFQALDRLHWTAAINVVISAGRLAGAIVLVLLFPHPSALQWGYLYFGSTTLVAVAVFCLVSTKLGMPALVLRRPWAELREGFYFSISLSAGTIYNDIDKAMLARLSTLGATGIYGAAYRVMTVSFAPVTALLAAAYPNFFRKGTAGIAGGLSYAIPLLKRAAIYTGLAGLGLFLCAGLLPHVLGAQYAEAAEALRWLAVLPFLKSVHSFFSDALAGAGYQWLRGSIQSGVAVFNVFINLWLIPAYAWRGAAWSSIASDGLLACSIGAAAMILSRRVPTPVEIAR